MPEVTEFQLREAVAIKAYADPRFREQLLSDPRSAIESLIKVHLPDNLTIRIIEDTDCQVTLVIPPLPSAELGEDELDLVAGGVHRLADGTVADPSVAASLAGYQHPAFAFLDRSFPQMPPISS